MTAAKKKAPPRKLRLPSDIEICLNDLVQMHNQFVALDSGQGDAAASATATCIVRVAEVLGIRGPQINKLRANLGMEPSR